MEVDSVDNYNLYETKAPEPKMVHRDLIQQLYDNSIESTKIDDIVSVLGYINEIRRIRKSLHPRNYDTKEYQSLLEIYDQLNDMINIYFEDWMSEVRETLEYFRENVSYVKDHDAVEFVVSLTKLLIVEKRFLITDTGK